MYKTFGSQDDFQVTGNYFADRVGVFDGTLGHIPSDSYLNVDRAYATWSNILDQPLWFSVGRRPSTDGAPSNLRLNTERPGNGGVPSLMVNYAYDGRNECRGEGSMGLPAHSVDTVLFYIAADLYGDNIRTGRFVFEDGLQIGGGGIIQGLTDENSGWEKQQ